MIQLPHNWTAKPHQRGFFRYMEGGGKRYVGVWHRRAGKDASAINWTATAAMQRVGTYWHMLPTLRQARLAVWDGINRDGQRIIDQAWPEAVRAGIRNDEMKLQLVNGSVWQLCGSDNYNSLVGSNPVGVVFSEWSLTDPLAWDFVRPILRENGGWAIFIYTPRGRNHGHTLLETARANPQWCAEVLTVKDTGVVSLEDIDEERRSGMSEELIQQEYMCLAPETRVLTANLEWVEIRSLLSSPQDLIGLDEEAKDGRRKLRRAKVIQAWATEKECLRIDFANGASVVSSSEHPWLVKRPWRNRNNERYVWTRTDNLKVGDAISHSGLVPWNEDRSREGGYLAGIYDGEGCVTRRTISFAQNPGPVLDECLRLLRENGYQHYIINNSSRTVACGLHDSLRMLGSVRPIRLLKKAESIWNGAFPFNGKPPIQIKAITALGRRSVVGISTSTKTFIAEGFVSHNCSFEAPNTGSYYGRLLEIARREGRITRVPYDPALGVHTWWDLGVNDPTAIWFTQTSGFEHRVIDYYEGSGEGLAHYARVLLERGYAYAGHHFPHDVQVRELGSGKSRIETLRELGLEPQIVPNLPVDDGIEALRALLPLCWFDEVKCARGLEALVSYHRKYDEKRKCFAAHPEHDWASNGADAARYFAVGTQQTRVHKYPQRQRRGGWLAA